MRITLVGLRRIILVFIWIFHVTPSMYFSRVLVWYVRTRCTLYEVKQGCGVVSCNTFCYWGACWSIVHLMIWYRMYLREDCFFCFFSEIFNFFCRHLVVRSRYDWFFVSTKCDATHAGRSLFNTKRKRQNGRVWFLKVRVMLLLDISRAWMILTGTKLGIACGHTT